MLTSEKHLGKGFQNNEGISYSAEQIPNIIDCLLYLRHYFRDAGNKKMRKT